MKTTPNVFHKALDKGGRQAVLTAVLLAAVPVASWALGQQGDPASKGVTASAHTVPPKSPAQVFLKCKVIKTSDPGRDPFSQSAKEPVVTKGETPHIVSAPIIRTLEGMEARIGVTLDGSDISVKLRPTLDKGGKYKLTVEPGVAIGGKWAKSFTASALLRPNEWVRFQLQDAGGNYLGMQMLVQLVPIKPE